MRLFTALWPPAEAVSALVAATGVPPSGWRAVEPASWHLTLAFHGEADPGVLARRLDRAAGGLAAPKLRIAGAGSFPGVRWAGVQADAPERLDLLVRAAGGDPAEFVAHLTVLRRRRRPGQGADPVPATPWASHEGPWWRAQEVLLMVSEPAKGGARYRPVHRVPLAGE
ncbi:MAG TPA: 2'-5' RNA ligase family protein [Pseudonocardia sp.]